MRATEKQVEKFSQSKPAKVASDTTPVEFIEFSLALELLLDTHPVFADAVKAAIMPLDGEFLFELPHGEKPDSKGRVAVVRLSYAGVAEQRLAFVFLSDDGTDTSITAIGDKAGHLADFAHSFVAVIEKIGRH